MKVYIIRHCGHYLGGVSVVVAENETEAIALTKAELPSHGLQLTDVEITQLDTDKSRCRVLNNGDY